MTSQLSPHIHCTFYCGLRSEYFMSTFHVSRELTRDIPTRRVLGVLCCCCWRRPHALVTVHLEDAHGLKKQDITGAGQSLPGM